MKLVIHAGAHKTATTSIQNWLKPSKRSLDEAKVLYLEPAVLNEEKVVEALHDAGKADRAVVSNRLLRLLTSQSARTNVDTILLSHESILSFSNVHPDFIKNGFYGSMTNSAPCINRLADEYDVKLIFYVRRQDTYMASVYLEYLKRGNTYLDFQNYCDQVDFRNISWMSCLEGFSSLMDRVEICVKPFELIKGGIQGFEMDFLQAVGIETNGMSPMAEFPLSNESISKTTLQLMQACGPHLRPNERRMLGHYFRSKFPPSEKGKAKVLSDDLSKEIVSYFSDENERLFEKWMPAYSKISYCL